MSRVWRLKFGMRFEGATEAAIVGGEPLFLASVMCVVTGLQRAGASALGGLSLSKSSMTGKIETILKEAGSDRGKTHAPPGQYVLKRKKSGFLSREWPTISLRASSELTPTMCSQFLRILLARQRSSQVCALEFSTRIMVTSERYKRLKLIHLGIEKWFITHQPAKCLPTLL